MTLGRGLLAELQGHRLHELDDAVYVMASVAQVRGEPVLIPTSLGPGLAKLGRRSTKLGVEVPGQFAVGVDLGSAQVIPIPWTLDLRGDPLEALTSTFAWEGRDGLRFVSGPEDVRARPRPGPGAGDDRATGAEGIRPGEPDELDPQPRADGRPRARGAGEVRRADPLLRIDVDRCGRSDRRSWPERWRRIVSEDRLDEEDRLAEEMSADDIDGAFVPVPRPDVTAVVLDGEAVLLAEGASEAHYLDEIATLVWSTFDGSATLDELAADFAEVFNADVDVVRGDIVALTQGIGRAGLLVGVAYEAPPDPSFASPTGVAVGEPIPPFRLPDADGRRGGAHRPRGAAGAPGQLEPPVRLLHADRAGARGAAAGAATRAASRWCSSRSAMRRRTGRSSRNTACTRGSCSATGSDVEVFAGVGTPSAYLVDAEGKAASSSRSARTRSPTLLDPLPGDKGAHPPVSSMIAPTAASRSPWVSR